MVHKNEYKLDPLGRTRGVKATPIGDPVGSEEEGNSNSTSPSLCRRLEFIDPYIERRRT
jgi:hypothetical protein